MHMYDVCSRTVLTYKPETVLDLEGSTDSPAETSLCSVSSKDSHAEGTGDTDSPKIINDVKLEDGFEVKNVGEADKTAVTNKNKKGRSKQMKTRWKRQ